MIEKDLCNANLSFGFRSDNLDARQSSRAMIDPYSSSRVLESTILCSLAQRQSVLMSHSLRLT